MATDVSVVIAYRDMGCEHRRASARYVDAWCAQVAHVLDGVWEIIRSKGTTDATFTRASAINNGVRRAAGQVIVQVDPDSLVASPNQIEAALTLARQADGLVLPHNRYLYLGPAATVDVLAGRPIDVEPADCEFYGDNNVGNVTVFSRTTWEAAGGFDERFGLWGGDDGAFAYACDALAGPTRRVDGDVIHLWHPRLPQSDPDHPDYPAQFALLAGYRDAAAVGPDAVRTLVESR